MFKTSRRGHGSAYDRGKADAWYARPFNPHIRVSGVPISVSGVPSLVDEYRRGRKEGQENWGEGCA